MPDTTTTNYALVKPEIGASNNTWGTKVNADLDAIDGLIKTNADAIALRVAKAGDTMTGPLVLTNATSAQFGLTKTGAGAGTAYLINDGGLSFISGAPAQNIFFRANSLIFENQSGSTQLAHFDADGSLTLDIAGQSYSLTDLNGGHPALFIDGSNNLVLAGTDASGVPRAIWFISMHTGSSLFNFSVPVIGITPGAGDNSTKLATTAYVIGALGSYLMLAGGTVAGNIVRSAAGPHLYHVDAAFGSGRVFVTAAGAADPTSAPGDIWIELT